MRQIDVESIGGDVALGYDYMQKAGNAVFDAVLRHLPLARVAIFCGKGNNGGDGLVVARLANQHGIPTYCFLLCRPDELSGEAALAYADYQKDGAELLLLNDNAALPDLSKYSLIVDALLGTGLNGNPRGVYAAAIVAINAADIPVISVDTPSGLNSTTAIPNDPCIKASETVVTGFAKLGQFFSPAAVMTGVRTVANLGYPQAIVAAYHQPRIWAPNADDLRPFLPPRKEYGSKFDHGQLCAVVGSNGMSGAAGFATLAALRTGCGMAHVATPASVVPALAIFVPEAVVHVQSRNSADAVGLADMEEILRLAKKCQAVCIGCGLSHKESTGALVRGLVQQIVVPAVLDADGLNAFRDHVSELRRHNAALIITPHSGEWSRLFGLLPTEPFLMIEALMRVARERKLIIVHKGNPTIVVAPDERAYLLPFGNSALSTAGTGDVLTGIIASLLAQGAQPLEATLLGVYLHQIAGKHAAAQLTEYGVIARDVIAAIPQAIAGLLK